MSTLDATVSMLEKMQEEARLMVFKYTQSLFTAPRPANPFTPKSKKDILDDLSKSREQIADGKGVDMKEALQEMGAKHGFL